MRKNKTYEQQKKFYDKKNEYESLGAIFLHWLNNFKDSESMLEIYRECKEYIWEDLYHLCDQATFYKFVRIFNFCKK